MKIFPPLFGLNIFVPDCNETQKGGPVSLLPSYFYPFSLLPLGPFSCSVLPSKFSHTPWSLLIFAHSPCSLVTPFWSLSNEQSWIQSITNQWWIRFFLYFIPQCLSSPFRTPHNMNTWLCIMQPSQELKFNVCLHQISHDKISNRLYIKH